MMGRREHAGFDRKLVAQRLPVVVPVDGKVSVDLGAASFLTGNPLGEVVGTVWTASRCTAT